jgi:hypothetical protein
VVVVGKARARSRRENDVSPRHCERQRSNPVGLHEKLDCFVALLLAMTRLGQVGAFTASLPGLTRQSMRGFGSLRFAALFDSWRVSMDHRVKPGGDDGEGGEAEGDEAQRDDACSSLRAAAKQSSGLAREAGLLRRCRSSQ